MDTLITVLESIENILTVIVFFAIGFASMVVGRRASVRAFSRRRKASLPDRVFSFIMAFGLTFLGLLAIIAAVTMVIA